MKKSSWITLGIIVVAIIALFLLPKGSNDTKLDSFAQCIKDSGTTFYGAFWCPHCQAQKKLFGGSVSKLPYVECSNPDQSQNATCNNMGIQSYPTWVFPDHSTTTGEVPLDELASKTNCSLPK